MTTTISQQKVVRVTKVFSFDMAHALDEYDGLCKNIHGHTYHLRITVKGKVLVQEKHPSNGMVIDFGLLKKLVKEIILDRFDHALVLKESSNLITEELLKNNQRFIQTTFQPSCENLLTHFVALLQPELPKSVELTSMRLDETPTSFAEWFLSDQ